MNSNFYKKITPLLLLIFLMYLAHEGLFYVLKIDISRFHYSLPVLYLCFTIFTLSIVFILLLVQRKNFDTVGMSFLWATSIKMIFCYAILRPVLQLSSPENLVEKINFLSLFVLFLLLETGFTIGLVNEKKK
jgi:hypothetical protein